MTDACSSVEVRSFSRSSAVFRRSNTMAIQSASKPSGTHRLVAQGRLLAAFLNDDTAAQLAAFARLPAELKSAVRGKFDAQPTSPAIHVAALFRHVDEPEVLHVLAGVAPCAGPT